MGIWRLLLRDDWLRFKPSRSKNQKQVPRPGVQAEVDCDEYGCVAVYDIDDLMKHQERVVVYTDDGGAASGWVIRRGGKYYLVMTWRH